VGKGEKGGENHYLPLLSSFLLRYASGRGKGSGKEGKKLKRCRSYHSLCLSFFSVDPARENSKKGGPQAGRHEHYLLSGSAARATKKKRGGGTAARSKVDKFSHIISLYLSVFDKRKEGNFEERGGEKGRGTTKKGCSATVFLFSICPDPVNPGEARERRGKLPEEGEKKELASVLIPLLARGVEHLKKGGLSFFNSLNDRGRSQRREKGRMCDGEKRPILDGGGERGGQGHIALISKKGEESERGPLLPQLFECAIDRGGGREEKGRTASSTS